MYPSFIFKKRGHYYYMCISTGEELVSGSVGIKLDLRII